MKANRNIRLSRGIKYSVSKVEIDAGAGGNLEEVVEVKTEGKKAVCSTKLITIYDIEIVKPAISDLKRQSRCTI